MQRLRSFAAANEFPSNTDHLIYGDRKADALGAGPNGDVYTDEFAMNIDKRPARITRVNTCVRLNELFIGDILVQCHIALRSTNYPRCYGVLIAKGIADRDDWFANHQI